MNVHALATIAVESGSSGDLTLTGVLWLLYGGVAFVLLLTGAADYFDNVLGNRRKGARRLMAAPVWPVVFIVLTVIALVDFAVGLWKDAK